MAAIIQDQIQDSPKRPQAGLNKFRVSILLVLLALLGSCLTMVYLTRDAILLRASLTHPQSKSAAQSVLTEPWQTAIDVASTAVTAEEHQFARKAETLADHEVHQAFQSALDQAQIEVQKLRRQPEPRRLAQIVEQRQQTVNQDQAIIKSLTPPKPTDQPNEDLDLTTAQLELDTDELKDAQQTLTRALGDERGQLEQELAAHEASVKKFNADAAAKSLSAVATSKNYATLLDRLKAWSAQRNRYAAIEQAAAQTTAAIASLNVQQGKMQKPSTASAQSADNGARMDAMKSASMYKQMRFIVTDRIANRLLLADTYNRWAAQVLIQHRIVFHLLMESLAWLVVIVLAALVFDMSIAYILDPAHSTAAMLGRNQYSIRVILRLLVQIAAAAAVFLLIFGPPGEISTVIGLTTAGLTVVLQDFIISFCGWFVLMGKHGIRISDWVEINGTTGEVADIGLFRTAILETGNWTDLGHPTGRRITFANSFAIKGEYFNFTTGGQWMWDELIVTVPAAEAYGTIELIHKAALEETRLDSERAEDEWRRAGRSVGVSQMNTEASVNMRPSASGIDIVVRYVTRAAARIDVRNALYLRVLEIIHKPE